MSKAILIMDMPNSCDVCDFEDANSSPFYYIDEGVTTCTYRVMVSCGDCDVDPTYEDDGFYCPEGAYCNRVCVCQH